MAWQIDISKGEFYCAADCVRELDFPLHTAVDQVREKPGVSAVEGDGLETAHDSEILILVSERMVGF